MNVSSFAKIRLLGTGSVGDVYLVRQEETNELYAMKVINKNKIDTKKKLERIRTERDILSKIDHPFIVKMHLDAVVDDSFYFILDYCSGGDLYRLIQIMPDRRLSEDHTRFYCAEILVALEYLHIKGYIHRDLKTENVLVHGSGHVKLADFSLAKQSDEPSVVDIVQDMFNNQIKYVTPKCKIHCKPTANMESFVGTMEYLAPEIFSSAPYSAVVDWWSFGILMYEMLCGVSPFVGSNHNMTKNNIESGKLQFPPNISISKDAKKLIKELLKTNPKMRLGSKHGASDIKEHDFFQTINWGLVRNMKPPIIPHNEKINTENSS